MYVCAFVLIAFHWKGAVRQNLNHIESIQNQQNKLILTVFEDKFKRIKNAINATVTFLELDSNWLTNERAIKNILRLSTLNEQLLAVLSFADKDNNYYSIFREAGSAGLMYAHADSSGVMTSGLLSDWDVNTASLQTFEGFFANTRPWFIQAQQNFDVVWSTIYQHHSTGASAVGASKVVQKDMQQYGVVAADYFLDDLSVILRNASLDQPGLLLMFDSQKNLIADNVLLSDSGRSELKVNTLKNLDNLFSKNRAKDELIFQAGDLLFNKMKINLAGSGHFWLVNVHSEAKTLAGVHQSTKSIIWVSLAIMLLGSLVFYYFSGIMFQSLRRLESVSRRISRGEWGGEFPGSKIKEVDSLARAYDYMSHQIKLTVDDLEEQVSSRTQNLKRLNEELIKTNLTDTLTQIGNRRLFIATMNRIFDSKQAFVLAIMDIDHFKKYNDNHGHLAGDEALVLFGALLKTHLDSNTYSVTRVGGEEFAVISMHGDLVEFVKQLKGLQQQLKLQKLSFEGQALDEQLTVSIGVAEKPVEAVHWKEVYASADKALYKAKSTGRDCIVVSAESV